METQPNPRKKRNYRRIGKVSSYDTRRIHSSLHPTDAPDIRHHSSLGNNCLFPVEDWAINPNTGTHIYQICNIQPSSCIPRITKRDPTIRYGIYKLLARSGAHARTPVPRSIADFSRSALRKKIVGTACVRWHCGYLPFQVRNNRQVIVWSIRRCGIK